MKKLAHTGLPWLLLTVIVLVLDQVSKKIIVNTMGLDDSINVLPFFSLTYTHNYGAAFGMLSNESGLQRWLFVILASAVTIGIVIWLARLSRQEKLTAIGLSLILGGAIGNLIDRITIGYVIDFCHFFIGNWSWYIFNIADVAICVGAFLMIIPQRIRGESFTT